MSGTKKEESWHLDKRIPVALFIGLAGQAAFGVWFASKLVSEIDSHARRITALEIADNRAADESRRISEQLARMDERMQAQTAILRRLEDAVRLVPFNPQGR